MIPPNLATGALDRAAVRMLHALAGRITAGRLDIVLPDGTRCTFAGREPGPEAALHVRRTRMVRRLALGGAIGFAEAYVDGDFDTPDLVALIALGAANEAALGRTLRGGALARLGARLVHRMRPNTRSGSRRNIAAHYDLGNAFYALWLDPTLTYSAGLFAGGTDLEAAQRRKYARMAAIGRLAPDRRVLEIGTGWGGFARFAATEVGCRVTTVTISRAQFEHVAAMVQREGLAERVDVRLQDYRDVTGRFDRIASIEMLEAVGERRWPVYFDRLRTLLEPGGIAALQVITIADELFERYRLGADFIQRHVFPGGMLPSPAALGRETARAGLTWREDAGFGLDYAETLAIWRRRFLAAWPRIRPLGFDERFRRLWAYYLAYCEVGFRTGRTDLRQIALAAG